MQMTVMSALSESYLDIKNCWTSAFRNQRLCRFTRLLDTLSCSHRESAYLFNCFLFRTAKTIKSTVWRKKVSHYQQIIKKLY